MTRTLIASLVLVGMAVSSAHADQIVFSNATGNWQNNVGGNIVIGIDLPLNGPDTILWGGNIEGVAVASGYQLMLDPALRDVLGNAGAGAGIAAPDGTPFAFATLTHINQPIPDGTEITSIEYALSFESNGIPQFLGPRILEFTHVETPNSCGAVGDPCTDDTITIATLTGPIVDIQVNSWLWGLELLGFSDDGGVTFQNTFFSPENGTNAIELYAIATSNHDVPEPSTAGMALFGLVALVGARFAGRSKS